MKTTRSYNTNAPSTKRRRKEDCWRDSRLLRKLPGDVTGAIMNIWLPLHWAHIWEDESRALEKKGFFEKRVYIRRFKTKDKWFVDWESMEAEHSGYRNAANPSGFSGHLRLIYIPDFTWTIDYYALDLNYHALDPAPSFPAQIHLRPRSRKDEDVCYSQFQAVYSTPTAAFWKAVRHPKTRRVLRYIIGGLTVERSLTIERHPVKKTYEICHRKHPVTLLIK